VSETADGRLDREEILTRRLHDAVFVSPAAAERALRDGATRLRIELLRGVLIGADRAMRAEHIELATRDRVCHHIIFGTAPHDPTATPDEQIEAARAEEEQYIQEQKALAAALLPSLPPELLASIPTPEQQAKDALAELQEAVAKLHVSEEPGDSGAAWEIAREAVEWAMSVYGPPGELHGAYAVVLQQPLEDDAAEAMMRLLMSVRGVVAVVPLEEDHQTRVAEERVRDALSGALNKVLDPFWSTRRTAPVDSI